MTPADTWAPAWTGKMTGGEGPGTRRYPENGVGITMTGGTRRDGVILQTRTHSGLPMEIHGELGKIHLRALGSRVCHFLCPNTSSGLDCKALQIAPLRVHSSSPAVMTRHRMPLPYLLRADCNCSDRPEGTLRVNTREGHGWRERTGSAFSEDRFPHSAGLE